MSRLFTISIAVAGVVFVTTQSHTDTDAPIALAGKIEDTVDGKTMLIEESNWVRRR